MGIFRVTQLVIDFFWLCLAFKMGGTSIIHLTRVMSATDVSVSLQLDVWVLDSSASVRGFCCKNSKYVFSNYKVEASNSRMFSNNRETYPATGMKFAALDSTAKCLVGLLTERDSLQRAGRMLLEYKQLKLRHECLL